MERVEEGEEEMLTVDAVMKAVLEIPSLDRAQT
jgi:hypothetical protein